eukprot:SAG11_NODE_8862_length_968_cov_7.046030_1_plen_85_part_10
MYSPGSSGTFLCSSPNLHFLIVKTYASGSPYMPARRAVGGRAERLPSHASKSEHALYYDHYACAAGGAGRGARPAAAGDRAAAAD